MAKRWDTDDGDSLLRYNALDTVATARVYAAIVAEEEWSSPRCQKLFSVHEGMSKLGAELHDTGFYTYSSKSDLVNALGADYRDHDDSKLANDRRTLKKVLRTLSTKRHNELRHHVGPRRSPMFRGTDNDMRALLYHRHSKPGIHCYDIAEPEPWDDVMWTNEQQTALAVDKEALLRIFIDPATHSEARDAIALFWRAKAPNKAVTTWVAGEQVLSKIGADNRMRADWNSAGTETMRWASELMTLPQAKDDESLGGRLPNIRSIYGATKDHTLHHWDYKSQELWMLAAVSGDQALIAALKTGDVYSHDARTWFPAQLQKLFGAEWQSVNLKKLWPNGRRQCKVGHLAAQYMAGAPVMWTQGLMQDRSITFSAMKAIRELFHRTYAATVEYAHAEHARVLECGYSEGRILHGRRYYPAPPPITETCNYPVQRTAGEMGAIAMLRIAENFKKYKVRAKILTNEHDAGTNEIHDDATTRRVVSEIVHEAAVGPWEIDGKKWEFKIDEHFGKSWADACAD